MRNTLTGFSESASATGRMIKSVTHLFLWNSRYHDGQGNPSDAVFWLLQSNFRKLRQDLKIDIVAELLRAKEANLSADRVVARPAVSLGEETSVNGQALASGELIGK
jgi:hypothetical protein